MNFLLIIKPEAYRYAEEIIKKIEESSITILAMKSLQVGYDDANKLYEEHSGKYFHNTLINYLTMGESILIVIETDVIKMQEIKKSLRQMYKQFDWEALFTITLNKLHKIEEFNLKTESFGTDLLNEFKSTFDAIHCSDPNQGEREINLFFSPEELEKTEPSALRNFASNARLDYEKMIDIILQKLQDKQACSIKHTIGFFKN